MLPAVGRRALAGGISGEFSPTGGWRNFGSPGEDCYFGDGNRTPTRPHGRKVRGPSRRAGPGRDGQSLGSGRLNRFPTPAPRRGGQRSGNHKGTNETYDNKPEWYQDCKNRSEGTGPREIQRDRKTDTGILPHFGSAVCSVRAIAEWSGVWALELSDRQPGPAGRLGH
jgi:hypothetical protein